MDFQLPVCRASELTLDISTLEAEQTQNNHHALVVLTKRGVGN